MAEFADLATTTWRGDTADLLPVDGTNSALAPNGEAVPIFGHCNFFITDQLQLVLPMTPNGRHQPARLQRWVAEHGPEAEVTFTCGSFTSSYHIRFHADGIAHNLARF